MTAAKQAYNHLVQNCFLADDYFFQIGEELIAKVNYFIDIHDSPFMEH